MEKSTKQTYIRPELSTTELSVERGIAISTGIQGSSTKDVNHETLPDGFWY